MPGQPLDSILRKDLLGSRDNQGNTSYESINSSIDTISFDTSGSEQGVVVQFDYTNGLGLDVDFIVEGSIDNVSFAPIDGADQNITDANGTITFDITDLNANYIRASFTVTSGSVDVYVQASAKRRH